MSASQADRRTGSREGSRFHRGGNGVAPDWCPGARWLAEPPAVPRMKTRDRRMGHPEVVGAQTLVIQRAASCDQRLGACQRAARADPLAITPL